MEESPPTSLSFQGSQRVKLIRDYTFMYSELDISVPGTLEITFPRIGYLVLYVMSGDTFVQRFLNYHQSPSLLNRFYINGLFSEGSLAIQQSGTGGGYAVKVHPVIGYHLLKVPLSELTNRQLLLSEVLDREGRLLRELEADLLLHPFDNAFFQQFFEKILPDKSTYRNDPIYHAVNTIIEQRGRVAVAELSQEYCMSERTLRRQFLLKVGLSPQAYAKIWQLQHVMELLMGNPQDSLEEIAYDAGYYDVAHLSRDFRNKVSFTPSQLDQHRNGLNEHYLTVPSSFK
ncbi:MAG: helix-turn-helix domain-containing protein [Tunicatimonas sp.]|uniref:AraC family transcriptional regulator n=1 Tax=Tunicatimonas sp. TaxID=1940096 RepID=UPI003C74F16B